MSTINIGAIAQMGTSLSGIKCQGTDRCANGGPQLQGVIILAGLQAAIAGDGVS
ncbi:hypothetical protein D3C75_1077640 [compost metagenome]